MDESSRWQLTIDCADPGALAAFWAATLGHTLDPPPEGHDDWDSFLDAQGVPEDERNAASAISAEDGPRIYFQRVPEPKSGKNRLHIDVPVSGGPGEDLDHRIARQDAARDRLVALGASEVGPVTEHGSRWLIMRDPEGNEFCLT